MYIQSVAYNCCGLKTIHPYLTLTSLCDESLVRHNTPHPNVVTTVGPLPVELPPVKLRQCKQTPETQTTQRLLCFHSA